MNIEYDSDDSESNPDHENIYGSEPFGIDGSLDMMTNTQLNQITNTQSPSKSYHEIDIKREISHVVVMIEGIEVLFPFKPYQPQIEYMRKVIQALNNSQNALLESPTGTGKTLCLLCASLAWMHHNKSNARIFYSSRTHTQLKQVFEQLKKTCYRPVTTILASRDFSCVKYKDQFKGPKLVKVCQKATRPPKKKKDRRYGEDQEDEEIEEEEELDGVRIPPCEYYKKFKENDKSYFGKYSRALCDIEDLFKEGEKNGFCPYYLQNMIQEFAHIVFVPYAYLINPFIRSRMNITLGGKIIIFDEAHNIEKQIEEANSYEISLKTLQKCQVYFENLNEFIRKLQLESGNFDFEEENETKGGNKAKQENEIEQDKDKKEKKKSKKETLKEILESDIRQLERPIMNLVELFIDIKTKLENNFREKLAKRDQFSKESSSDIFQRNKLEVHIGRKIFDFYKHKMKDFSNQILDPRQQYHFLDGIDETNFRRFLDVLKHAYGNKHEKIRKGSLNTLANFSDHVCDLLMMDFEAKRKNLQFNYSENFIESYKLCFSLETPKDFDGDLESIPRYFEEDFFGLKVKLVCLNPGIGFAGIANRIPRSIILTSGTLTPLDSFQSELMTSFPIQLLNGHVIKRDQCKAFVVSEGPSRMPINLSYDYLKAYSDTVFKELGNLLIYIAQKVPNGMLVCFSSYGVRNKCIQNWEKTQFENTDLSIYQILKSIKPIYKETKNPDRFKQEIESYRQNASTEGGAILFCVCRGKVSEGIDFANEAARAVFLVGLPLPPIKDPMIEAKRNFLEDKRKKNKQGLSAQEWYNQEATRAFNQAIGRVIRNKDDYGLVFLCEQRYCEPRYIEQLSNWIKPTVEIPLTFQHMLNKVTPFFQRDKPGIFENPSDDILMPLQSQEQPLEFPLQSTPSKLPNLKRASTQPVRDQSELKKVLKTSNVKTQSFSSTSTQILEGVDEFDVAPDQVFNHIQSIQNTQHTMVLSSQNQRNQTEDTNRFPLAMSQGLPTFMKASTLYSDILEAYSTQEATNSNIFNPPRTVRQLFNRGNSLESCDSSDPLCEACSRQQPINNFKSPSKDGKPVCDKCWNSCEDCFN